MTRKKILLISSKDEYIQTAVLEKGRLEDFFTESKAERTYVGNIYKGIVEDIVPSVGACFVNIGLEKKGFLYLSDVEEIFKIEEEEEEEGGWFKKIFFPYRKKRRHIKELKPGQEVPVQVIKDPYGRKGARLTSHITLPSRTLVLIYGSKHFGVSRKISNIKERKRLKNIIKDLRLPENCGIIARTLSESQDREKILLDYKYIIRLWKTIQERSKRRRAPALIYEEHDLVLRTARDFLSKEISALYIDNEKEYHNLRVFCDKFFSELKNRIIFYSEGIPLFYKFSVIEEIQKIFSPKVVLKNGGYIIIERTEALTTIDVNSGGYSADVSQEEGAFLVNKEAAKEIARQLRLRDIGGIIVIDFIDMKKRENRDRLCEFFRSLLNQDKARTEIVVFSPLGLLEMTRHRTRKDPESIYLAECPCCRGSGKVKSRYAVAQEIILELKKVAASSPGKRVVVKLHPEILEFMQRNLREQLIELKRDSARERFLFLPAEGMPLYEYYIENKS